MKLLTALAGAVLLMLAVAPPANADRVYHSEHVSLMAVGNAPLKTGFVENIHANGPNNYAHEIYALSGAEAGTTYEVHLLVYPFDADCSEDPAAFGSVELTTNRRGNGLAQRFISPGDVPIEIRDAVHGVRWEVRLAGSTMYETECSAVTLD